MSFFSLETVWACYANDAAAIKDTNAFDQAIAKAMDFFKEHPQETVIVVTDDHECSGMTLGFAGTKYATSFESLKTMVGSIGLLAVAPLTAVAGGFLISGHASATR